VYYVLHWKTVKCLGTNEYTVWVHSVLGSGQGYGFTT